MSSKKTIFFILSLSIFSSMLGVGIISPLLPIYAKNLGATGIELGIIFAGFSIARAISMHVIGRTSDIYGRKIFICIGLFIYALMSMGYALSKTALHLGTVRFLQGFAAGMIMPIATAYIGDIAPKGREGTYMGYFYVAFFLGFGIGPLIGGFLSDYSGMKIAFYTMGGFNFIAFILAFSLLPKIESHRQTNKTQIPYTTMIRESKVISGLFADSIGVKFSFYFAAGLELVGFLLFAIFTTQKTNRVKS